MSEYYAEKLSAERLELCYKLAPPRVVQYLEAEVSFVGQKIKTEDYVLEMGCGYGRVLKSLHSSSEHLYGTDNAVSTLTYARTFLSSDNCYLSAMDAYKQGFKSGTFDLVFCIQNGISAFGGDPGLLIDEAVRITKKGGTVLFSTYSYKFWDHRLEWFEIQSEYHLIGEIDYYLTGNGTIVCKDGFRATTFNVEKFKALTEQINGKVQFYEVDQSSLFCEVIPD